MSYFKKFGNITSCRIHSRKNAKVQQARIVYNSAFSITHFDTQWAVYCFSTCLRVTPCHYTVEQKSSRREFVATLTQLPPNTKDIDLAPLTRDLSAKAVNVPLSLNSYKPKHWAYITFNSQETMDAAMEQIIGFRGCASNQCPSCQQRGRTRDKNPVAALRERFNLNQPARSKARSRSGSCLRSHSRGPESSRLSQPRQVSIITPNINNPSQHDRSNSKSSDRRDRSVSFSASSRAPHSTSPCSLSLTMSPHEANNILSILKALQHDMAEVCECITALELNDRRMTRIEQHLGLSLPATLANHQTSDMLIDPPASFDLSAGQMSSQLANSTTPKPLNSLIPNFILLSPVRAPSLHSQLLLFLIISHPLRPLTLFPLPYKLAMKFRLLMRSIQL
ncbi:hypothetical protein RclHR1_20180003 [Rhizophagus clarus]|uniref:RRM domain-containing protein n=1 Tax=Rhizophagus clarus TaxID=94130 RepID=A0A2Z6R6B2_9GLOM|nr:hypothetical protein RclHR1_20180003 [Rhizophagus clarus]